MAEVFNNLASSTLASGITAGAVTLTIASGDGNDLFPSLSGADFFRCVLFNKSTGEVEIIRVTARSADTFTIVRATEGIGNITATSYAFSAGDLIELRTTSAFFTALSAGATSYNIQENVFKYATDTGAENSYVINPSPVIYSYNVGQEFWFIPSNTNTSDACTLSVSGVSSPPSIKKLDGSNPEIGEIASGRVVHVFNDGTNFVIMNVAENVMDYTNLGDVEANKVVTADASGNINLGTGSYVDQWIKAEVTGSSASSIEITGLPGAYYGGYEAILSIVEGSVSSNTYLEISGDTTAGNYFRRTIVNLSSSVNYSFENDNKMFDAGSGNRAGHAKFIITQNIVAGESLTSYERHSPYGGRIVFGAITYITSAQVTSVKITSAGGTLFGVGTKLAIRPMGL